jgi:hypothetical protein
MTFSGSLLERLAAYYDGLFGFRSKEERFNTV